MIIIEIPTLPSDEVRATWTEYHIVTMCAVLHMPGNDPDEERGACVGHCPACHLVVFDSDDPVWTCPADLSEQNPHREAADPRITEELMRKHGVYSNCGEDHGWECDYEPMPLHGECYGSTTLTY